MEGQIIDCIIGPALIMQIRGYSENEEIPSQNPSCDPSQHPYKDNNLCCDLLVSCAMHCEHKGNSVPVWFDYKCRRFS